MGVWLLACRPPSSKRSPSGQNRWAIWHHVGDFTDAPARSTARLETMWISTLPPRVRTHHRCIESLDCQPEICSVLARFYVIKQLGSQRHPILFRPKTLHFRSMRCLLHPFGVLPLEITTHAVTDWRHSVLDNLIIHGLPPCTVLSQPSTQHMPAATISLTCKTTLTTS